MCPGPLIWYHITTGGGVMECACCGYIVVSGNLIDDDHVETAVMREPTAPKR